MNVARKRDSKTHILNLDIESLHKLKASTEGTDVMATAVADKVMSVLNVEVAHQGRQDTKYRNLNW